MGTLYFIVLGLISSEHSFIPSSSFSSSDCGVSAVEAIAAINFDLLPKPANVPGVLNLTISGNVHEVFGNDVILNVTMQKYLINRWTKLPCAGNVGSCFYANPCEFVQVYAHKGGCLPALEQNGLKDYWYGFVYGSSGDFRVHVELTRNETVIGSFTSTASFKRSDHSSSGFLFA